MPVAYAIPRPSEDVLDANGHFTVPWQNYLRTRYGDAAAAEIIAALEAQIADLLARVEALEEGETARIVGPQSVSVVGSLANGLVQLTLVNDEEQPLPVSFYATNENRDKGWQLLQPDWAPNPLLTYLVDEDGNYLTDENGNFLPGNQALIFITSKNDLPDAVGGIITLADKTAYWIMNPIDLTGDRIMCGANNVLLGNSFGNALITSTGLTDPLISSASSLRLDGITLSSATGPVFDLDDASGTLFFYNLSIINSPTIGTIKNYGNILWNTSNVVNSANLTLDGSISSFVCESSIWDGRSGQNTITVPSTATFARRFRMVYCVFVVNSGETGINFSSSATIPDESYILDNVNFSGGGTYLSGLTYTSNKAQFFNCVGITNSSAIVQYYMVGNATATVIGSAGTFVKVAGTTTPVSSLQQKFDTTTTNRAEYTGASPASFRVTAFASMSSSNNQLLRMRFSVNGTTLAESTVEFTTSGAGDASNIGTQALLTLNPTDYVEVWVTNDTATNNITVRDMNVIITRQN